MKGTRWDDYGDLMTLPQVARVLQIGRSTAYEWADKGILPEVRLGSLRRVPKQQLIEMLERRVRNGEVTSDEVAS